MLSGDFDMASAPALGSALAISRWIATPASTGPTRTELHRLHRHTRDTGGARTLRTMRVWVRADPGAAHVQRVFGICGQLDYFSFRDDGGPGASIRQARLPTRAWLLPARDASPPLRRVQRWVAILRGGPSLTGSRRALPPQRAASLSLTATVSSGGIRLRAARRSTADLKNSQGPRAFANHVEADGSPLRRSSAATSLFASPQARKRAWTPAEGGFRDERPHDNTWRGQRDRVAQPGKVCPVAIGGSAR